jgi:PAS domain S-box-containing protein
MDYQELIAKIGAILGSLGLSWAAIFRPIKRVIAKKAIENKEKAEKINKILKELAPNGGASLRDVINRIEHNTIRLENRFRAYVDLSNETGVFESDANGKWVFANKVLCDYLGLHPEQVMGNGWINGLFGADRQKVWDEWKLAIEQKRDFNMEYRLFNDQTQRITVVIVYATPLVYKGELYGWLGTSTPKTSYDAASAPK